MIERLIIAAPGADELDLQVLRSAFPTVAIETYGAAAKSSIAVDLAAWADPSADLGALDARARAAAARGSFEIRVTGECPSVERACLEILTRAQRFVDRRNQASSGPGFDRILAIHRALFDLSKPLVHADFEHAIDTWQWMLRLDSTAGVAVQAAALFHDVERLESEADVRVEHRAPSYDAFKDAHARRGAAITRAVLAQAGLPEPARDRAAHLVERHERPEEDAEIALLNEADALSFFSLNSAGFVDYYGVDHARMKVARSLGRLDGRGRIWVDRIRYRADVRALVQEALDALERAA